MRAIKFRAWDGEKLIHYPEWFTLHHQEVLCFSEPPHRYVDESDVDYPARVVLMQFTGLLDKNGKECFEGDLVCRPGYEDDEELHYEVVFRDGAFRLHVGTALTERDLRDFVIIGNKYEN